MSADVPPATRQSRDASLSDLLSELTDDLGTLMRQGVQLARVELRWADGGCSRSTPHHARP